MNGPATDHTALDATAAAVGGSPLLNSPDNPNDPAGAPPDGSGDGPCVPSAAANGLLPNGLDQPPPPAMELCNGETTTPAVTGETAEAGDSDAVSAAGPLAATDGNEVTQQQQQAEVKEGAGVAAQAAAVTPDQAQPGGSGLTPAQQKALAANGETVPEGAEVVNYDVAFPTLAGDPDGGAAIGQTFGAGGPATAPTWGQKPLPKLKSKEVTQVFHLPSNERRLRSDQGSFDDRSMEQRECNEIMKKTGTRIELCESRDHSITIVVSGERRAVEEARKLIVQKLQMASAEKVAVPKEHHRILIGREGRKLAELEAATDCHIMIPGRHEESDLVTVIGPKEGIDRAIHQIKIISDEQSKLAQERLQIPRIFYPFIRGPNNENVDRLIQQTGARINIPPPTAASEEIIVTGEKEGVYQVVDELKRIYAEKQNSQTVSIQVAKPQHRFVIGPGGSALSEILRETGVSVEVPPTDSESDTLTLRGEADKLGQALTMVYAKASSVITDEVSCPQWLHKFIIGPRGSNIKAILGDPPAVQVSFEEEGYIFLEGSPEEVKRAKNSLAELSQNLQAELAYDIVKVEPKYHRHIIGKGGSNITKIKDETGVLVNIPDESTNSDEIRLEGKKEGVQRATEMIKEITHRMENEKSRDIIIDQRFHRQLIGVKGESLQKMKVEFPEVNISFPEQGRKSDIVSLRGPKDEVDGCCRKLQAIVKELTVNNYQVRVPIFKDFHRVIIGKGGQNIKKIREETDTKIDIPSEDSKADEILITGKQASVEKARDMLNKIQNDLASVVTSDISIPAKLHSSLLYGGGRLIHAIQEDCGGVNIKFPPENAKSDKVTIRGPKDDVEKAKRALNDLAKDKELSSHTADLKAKPEYHGFLIGKGGTSIAKIREKYPNVRIMFPRPQDADQETIHLIGKKEEVTVVKENLEKSVKDLQHTTEDTVEVDPKWHRHFVVRGGAVLREIQDTCGGIMISFPRQNSESSTVTLKGAKECVDAAKKRILEIAEDLELTIRHEATIPHQFHRVLLANRGARIQDITTGCGVQIKFPERPQSDADEHSDLVVITGRKENCEKAEEMMKALIPVNERVHVPFDYHRFLIGQKGTELRKLMDEFDVNVSIPPREDQLDEVMVTGQRPNVDRAVEAIKAKLVDFDNEMKDKELRSFKLTANVDPKYHSRIIGPKGKLINGLRTKFDVNIAIPIPGSETPDAITIIGYEAKAEACKEEILKIVADFESMVTQEITLDARIHPRLIGIRGRGIRKIMDDFKVEIRFPRNNDPDPNLVAVTGPSEDAVYDCIDHLRLLEEEYLQDVSDRYRYPEPPAEEGPRGKGQAFLVTGGPWSTAPPDTSNLEDFPSMGLGGEGAGAGAGSPNGSPPQQQGGGGDGQQQLNGEASPPGVGSGPTTNGAVGGSMAAKVAAVHGSPQYAGPKLPAWGPSLKR